MEVKKGILATVGGGIVAVGGAIGGFVWQNGGQDVAKEVTKTAIQQAAPEVKAMIPEPFKTHLAGKEIAPNESVAFQAAYEKCNDKTANNPKINLNDVVAVYDANVQCLLVVENQGTTLDKMAEKDAELKQTLAEIRQKLSQ